jgi:hypothetical protein
VKVLRVHPHDVGVVNHLGQDQDLVLGLHDLMQVVVEIVRQLGRSPGIIRLYLRTQSRHKSFKIMPSSPVIGAGARRALSRGGFCDHFHT